MFKIRDCAVCHFISLGFTITVRKDGGWTNKRTAEAFVKYAETCFKAFGDRVKHWITFNETVMFCGLGYLKGAHPPGIQNDVPKYFQATHYVFYAHAKTVAVYKRLKQYGEIGITHVFLPAYSVDDQKKIYKRQIMRMNMKRIGIMIQF